MPAALPDEVYARLKSASLDNLKYLEENRYPWGRPAAARLQALRVRDAFKDELSRKGDAQVVEVGCMGIAMPSLLYYYQADFPLLRQC